MRRTPASGIRVLLRGSESRRLWQCSPDSRRTGCDCVVELKKNKRRTQNETILKEMRSQLFYLCINFKQNLFQTIAMKEELCL